MLRVPMKVVSAWMNNRKSSKAGYWIMHDVFFHKVGVLEKWTAVTSQCWGFHQTRLMPCATALPRLPLQPAESPMKTFGPPELDSCSEMSSGGASVFAMGRWASLSGRAFQAISHCTDVTEQQQAQMYKPSSGLQFTQNQARRLVIVTL